MSDERTRSPRQGGDLRGLDGIRWDLSTCVNPYGPPPAVLTVLQGVRPEWMTHHPWAATERFLDAYAHHLGVSAEDLVPTHGASGAIWSLSQSTLAASVAIPLPAYTEYLSAFVNCTIGPPSINYVLEQIEDGMRAGRTVLISNPHNPSGTWIADRELLRIASENPGGRLVVDESYSDFLRRGDEKSITGSPFFNIAAIHSPSKFHGIPGVRAGVVWSRSAELRQCFTNGETWAVSELDARIVEAAFGDRRWESSTRIQLASDREWLVELLSPNVFGKPQANFVLRLIENAGALDVAARSLGLKVRVLGSEHGLSVNAVRISAPKAASRNELTDALSLFAS